jgi:hypothetical protein
MRIRGTRLGEFSPNGWLFTPDIFFENYRSRRNFCVIFSTFTVKRYIIWTKMYWAAHWAILSTNSFGHPDENGSLWSVWLTLTQIFVQQFMTPFLTKATKVKCLFLRGFDGMGSRVCTCKVGFGIFKIRQSFFSFFPSVSNRILSIIKLLLEQRLHKKLPFF